MALVLGRCLATWAFACSVVPVHGAQLFSDSMLQAATGHTPTRHTDSLGDIYNTPQLAATMKGTHFGWGGFGHAPGISGEA